MQQLGKVTRVWAGADSGKEWYSTGRIQSIELILWTVGEAKEKGT